MTDPSSEQARTWLEQELAGPEYQTSWWERLLRWLADQFDGGPSQPGSSAPLEAIAVGLGVGALVAIAVIVWRRVRARNLAPEAAQTAVLGERLLGSQQYRERAAAARAAGDHAGAFLDGYRAIAARAIESGVLPDAPGATAGDLGRLLAGRYPDAAQAIQHVSQRFDAIKYGGFAAHAADVDVVTDLEVALADSSPAVAGAVAALAVPR